MTPLTTSTPSSSRDDSGAGAAGAAVLAARLGHSFGDLSLLEHALAHRSWCGEQEGGAPSNERLEFLGDAVLGLVVAEYCFERYPEFPEGKLAKVRSAVVNARVLAMVAGRLGVGDVLLLGRGEEGSGGRLKASILSDAFEAILGAVYLDAGWDAARALVLRELGAAIAKAGEEPDDFDHKSACRRRRCATGTGRPAMSSWGRGPTTTGRTRRRCSWAGSRGASGPAAPRRTRNRRRRERRGPWEDLSASEVSVSEVAASEVAASEVAVPEVSDA